MKPDSGGRGRTEAEQRRVDEMRRDEMRADQSRVE
jgi:hypothetical protein